jgi:hypothetical protein
VVVSPAHGHGVWHNNIAVIVNCLLEHLLHFIHSKEMVDGAAVIVWALQGATVIASGRTVA